MGYSPPQPYKTPDGQTVSFPPEFAAKFQGLAPVQPEPLWQEPAPPVETGAQPTGLLPPLPSADAPAPQPQPSPASSGTGFAGFMQSAVPPQLAGPALEPTPQPIPDSTALMPPEAPKPVKAPAAPSATIPHPRTDADLGKIGQAGALNAQVSAIDQAAEAGRRAADVEAAAQAEAANAYQQRNSQIDAQLQERQRAAEERLQRVNAATVDANTAMRAYADHKVSREEDHPIMATIAMLLSGIGTVLNGGGENQAIAVLNRHMDKKVQLQLADRDKLKDVAGMKKQAIDQVRQAGDDKIAMYNLAMAGETDKAIRKIEEIKARSSSESVKANADVMVAGLRERQAGLLGQAVDRRMTLEEQKAARAQAAAQHAAGLSEQRAARLDRKAEFGAELRYKYDALELAKQKEANDREIALAKSTGKGSDAYQKLAKETEERGIRDPATGDILVSAQGKAKMEEAAKFEERAKAIRSAGGGGAANETLARQAEEKAAMLRDEARTVHAIRGRSPDQAAKAQATLGTSQSMLSLIDNITNKARKSGTKVLNQSELQAALETELGLLGLDIKDLYTLGSLDDGASKYLKTITGGDPSKMSTAGFIGALGIGADSSEKTIAKLDALARQVEQRGLAAVTGLGLKPGEFKFRRDDETKRPESQAVRAILDEKTPLERAAGEERGIVGKGAEALLNPVGDSPTERRQRDVEQRTSAKYPGLSPEQERPMGQLLAQARGAGDQAAQARAKLIALASENAAGQPALSNAVLNVLRAEAPDMYKQAVAALPDEQRTARETLGRVGREGESLPDLETRATARDEGAIQELQRRAFAKPGGAEAKAFTRVLRTLQGSR